MAVSSFVFTQARSNILSGALDLSVPANYYLVLVTTAPTANANTVADLVVSDATGYQPQLLLGQNFSANVLSFDDATFESMSATTPIVGAALCKRAGGSFSGTDQAICFSQLSSGGGSVVQATPNAEKIKIQFDLQGILSISDLYGYSAGAYSGAFPDTSGVIYLLGSNNGTVAFSNPAPNKISVITQSGAVNGANLFDRDVSAPAVNDRRIAIDFHGDGSRKIKVKPTKGFCRCVGATNAYQVFGSNTLPSFSPSFLDSGNGYWTSLGDVLNNAVSTLSATTHYRWFFFYSPYNGDVLGNVEFYEADVISDAYNFV